MTELKDLALDHFAPRVGSQFQCRVDEAETTLHLDTAQAIPTAQKLTEGQRKPFSLTFKGPRSTPLDQGTYALRHADLGEQEMFLVPVHEDEESRYYEAVFT